MSNKTMKRIAISGVMGAGKSTVIEILKEMKYTVLDCDRINDELLLSGHLGYEKLIQAFGSKILDEQRNIDRQKMSNIIFSNLHNKEIAERILHPLIKERIEDEYKVHENEAIVFVEVPLLFEIGWEPYFDEIWVVASDEAILLERLISLRGVCKVEAQRRLAQQMSQKEKIKKADVIIWNNSNKEHLKQDIYDILVDDYRSDSYGKKRRVL